MARFLHSRTALFNATVSLTGVATTEHRWLLNTGLLSANSSPYPANCVLGAVDVTAADYLQIVGFARLLAPTGATACSDCALRMIAWGQPIGLPGDVIEPAGWSRTPRSVQLANAGGSLTGFVKTGVGNQLVLISAADGNTDKPLLTLNTSVANNISQWPLQADGTNPADGDQMQFSVWVANPEIAAPGDTFSGFSGPVTLSGWERVWIAMKFIPTLTAAFTGGQVYMSVIACVYRDVQRSDPREQNIVGSRLSGVVDAVQSWS